MGNWKAKVYDTFHVMVSVKSRRVLGAMTSEELFFFFFFFFAVEDDVMIAIGGDNDDCDDVLTTEEMMQLDFAPHIDNSDGICDR